jgi:hypothetical protein
VTAPSSLSDTITAAIHLSPQSATLIGAIAVALIAAATAQWRQRVDLDAAMKRQRAELDAEAGRARDRLNHERVLADLAELRKLFQEVLGVMVDGNVWVNEYAQARSPSMEGGNALNDRAKALYRSLSVGLGTSGIVATYAKWYRLLGRFVDVEDQSAVTSRTTYTEMVAITEQVAAAVSEHVGFAVPKPDVVQ